MTMATGKSWRLPQKARAASLALVCVSAILTLGVADNEATLKDPETEIALAQSELKTLRLKLEASKQMTNRLGLGPQTIAADRAFANAKAFATQGEHLSTIRELNNYLNLSQVPDLKLYLEAQQLLGQAYEAVGTPQKALRAYFRYLAAFLTSKDQNYPTLLDVLRRMIPLAAQNNGRNRELNELIASITSLEVPEDIKPVVDFFAAKAALNSGQRQQDSLALNWLESAVSKSKDPELKARALYVRSLMALADKDYDQAEELLTQIIQSDVTEKATPDQPKEASTKELARLALARVAVHRKKPELALKYYHLIEEKSPAFRSALFESIYVHLEVGHDSEARKRAMLFLERYPDDSDSYQLRTLLAYLDLRAGEVATAAQGIEAADKHLDEIGVWMGKEFNGKTVMTQSQLKSLVDLTNKQVALTPTVKAALELFARLAELNRGLADLRGDIRNILFTIGRLNIDSLHPAWVNRAEQLAGIADEVLKVGHRLAAAERHLYKNRLDKVSMQQLSASEDRRTRLLTVPAAARRKMQYWASYANFMDLTKDLADQHNRLQKAEADLAAARYLAQLTQDAKAKGERERRVADLQNSVQNLRNSNDRALELVRAQKVENLLNESPHRAARKFLTQYAMALHDESEIIKGVRDDTKSTAQRLMSDDASKAWNSWQQLSQEVYTQIQDLDTEIKDQLGSLLGELDQQEKEHDRLKTRVGELNMALENQMGKSMSYILSQYGGAIESRKSRHQKWRADLEWLSYKKTQSEDKDLNDKFNLEKQILQDNLQDLQQGVLWKWPEQ